jgi:hypothetical protein
MLEYCHKANKGRTVSDAKFVELDNGKNTNTRVQKFGSNYSLNDVRPSAYMIEAQQLMTEYIGYEYYVRIYVSVDA